MVSTLEVLAVDNCFLSGTIPTEVGQLTALRILKLGTNAPLTGPIPTELGLSTNLEVLDLSMNQLSGAVPVELGNIQTLREALLGPNKLVGSVPAEICSISSDANLKLDVLVVDCYGPEALIACDVPSCCSSCSNAP